MSPFYTEGDLAGTPVSFSPSVRRMRCSQVGRDVLRQDATVLRHAPRLIRIMRAQQLLRFPGIARDVLAPLQIGLVLAPRDSICGEDALKKPTRLFCMVFSKEFMIPPQNRSRVIIEHVGYSIDV